jgi:hypothetical protein
MREVLKKIKKESEDIDLDAYMRQIEEEYEMILEYLLDSEMINTANYAEISRIIMDIEEMGKRDVLRVPQRRR